MLKVIHIIEIFDANLFRIFYLLYLPSKHEIHELLKCQLNSYNLAVLFLLRWTGSTSSSMIKPTSLNPLAVSKIPKNNNNFLRSKDFKNY